jgi:K+-sensing histidine kinase KdpD
MLRHVYVCGIRRNGHEMRVRAEHQSLHSIFVPESIDLLPISQHSALDSCHRDDGNLNHSSAAVRQMKTKLLYTLQSTVGIAVSALCAIALALIFSKTPWKMAAPFLFVAVLVMLSSRFGAMVSVVGSILAAMIFAFLLFAPVRSLHVENETERATLAWMILLSVSVSYLLFPSRTDRTRS